MKQLNGSRGSLYQYNSNFIKDWLVLDMLGGISRNIIEIKKIMKISQNIITCWPMSPEN